MKFQVMIQRIKMKLFNIMIKVVPVQPKQRSTLNKISSVLLYVLDYVIIFKIVALTIMPIFQTSNTFLHNLLINIFRILFNVGYIVTKQKLFICGQKLCILMLCSIQNQKNLFLNVPALLFDLVSCIVWSLSIQQKILHFDSRLFVFKAFLKQILINLMYSAWIQKLFLDKYNQIYLMLFCISLLLIDRFDHIYNKKFKNLLVFIDISFVLSTVLKNGLQLARVDLQQDYIVILSSSSIIISCLCAYLHDYQIQILHITDPWKNKLQPQDALQYFLQLNSLITQRDQNEMIQYIMHHIEDCREIDCYLKYHQSINKNIGQMQQLRQTIRIFQREQITKLSNKYQILQHYLIFNYLQRSYKVSKKLNLNNFFHKREISELYHSNLHLGKHQNNSDMVLQLKMSSDLVQLIRQYTQASLKFWSQLIQYNINGCRIFYLAVQQIQLREKIEELLENKINLTRKNEQILTLYRKYLLKQNYKYVKKDKQSQLGAIQTLLSELYEAPPSIVVSAENQNFLKIINANLGAVKTIGFSKRQLTSISIDGLWQKEIRQSHIQRAKTRAGSDNFSFGKLLRQYVFFKNKFGYMIISDAIIYYLDDFTGKKWIVVMYPYLDNQSVLIFNSKRQLLGISQACLKDGLSLQLQGSVINQNLFNECKNQKKSIKLTNKKLFQNNDFKFPSVEDHLHVLKYQTSIDFLGKTYYHAFTVSRRQKLQKAINQQLTGSDFQLRYQKHSVQVKRMSNLSHINIESLNNDQRAPSFQFSFNFMAHSYIGNMVHYCTQQQHASVSNDYFQIKKSISQIEITNVDEQIVSMRLWRNQLDYIENLQTQNRNFESIPTNKQINQMQLNEQSLMQQIEARCQLVPQNVYWLRIFYGLFAIFILILLIYTSVSGSQFNKYNYNQLSSQNLIRKQFKQLLNLGVILIEGKHIMGFDTKSQIQKQISKIDEAYKQMQNMLTDYGKYIISQARVQNYSLLQIDQQYRILIDSQLNDDSSFKNSVQNHIIKYVYPGWNTINLLLFQNIFNSLANQKKYHIIFLVTSFLGFLAFLYGFFIYKSKLQLNLSQICATFRTIDHRAINEQIVRINSFINYLDFNDHLLNEQTLISIRCQQSGENIHQKRIVNKKKLYNQAIIFLLCIVLISAYLAFVITQEYMISQIQEKHIRLKQNSQTRFSKSRMIWLGLNSFPQNQKLLHQHYISLIQSQRKYQNQIKQLIGLQVSEEFKIFINQQFYINACKYLSSQCIYWNSTEKKSGKQFTSSYLKNYQKVLVKKYQNQTQFQSSKDVHLMGLVEKFYFSTIDDLISNKLLEQYFFLFERDKISIFIPLILVVVGLIFGILSYSQLLKRIKQIIKIQKILTCLPFQVLINNCKYLKFLQSNKTSLR